MKSIILFLALFPAFLSSQICEWRLDYEGPPGNIQTRHFDGNSGDWYQIDFIAYVVIDTLKFTSGGQTVSFPAGMDLPQSLWGYREYLYGIDDHHISGRLDSLPDDFEFPYWNSYGCIRVNYQIPKCGFDLSVVGNSIDFTLYHVCVKRMSPGTVAIDTVYSWNCDDENSVQYTYDHNGCRNSVIIYEGRGIEPPVEHNPTCIDSNDGWLEFKTIPNVYDIGVGYQKITVSNEWCKRQFSINLIPTELCDNDHYIPNIFSPNGDGINDIFTIFYPISGQEFQLEIWDRWGGLAYRGVGLTGISGWDGEGYQPGIYVYRISFLNKKITGQITLIQ